MLAIVGGRFRRRRRGRGQEKTALGELGDAMTVGEEAVVADAMESVWKGVQQEASDELVGAQGHDLGLVVVAIVLPPEADLSLVQAHKTAVGDGDAMGIAAKVGEDLFGAAERGLGVDDPFDPLQLGQVSGEGAGVGQTGEIAEEAELISLEGVLKMLKEQPPEQARQNPDRQEEA